MPRSIQDMAPNKVSCVLQALGNCPEGMTGEEFNQWAMKRGPVEESLTLWREADPIILFAGEVLGGPIGWTNALIQTVKMLADEGLINRVAEGETVRYTTKEVGA